ncbi:hypothetical protein AAC387_Pa09g2160 [Persea americana]
MKARLVVFPIKGRNWCFSRSADRTPPESKSSIKPQTFKDLWKKFSSDGRSVAQNAEIAIDFAAEKMNRAWHNLEKAPVGTFKNKLHNLGLRLMSRVKPSENFLKSISKEITKVEVTYPMSLNPHLVRRRLRHIAMRGSIIHRRYFYGSLSLLPFTAALTVLPMPNVPFFWILFRAYSHWQGLKGSEQLLLLISNCSKSQNLPVTGENRIETEYNDSKQTLHWSSDSPWVPQPSKELEKFLYAYDDKGCVSDAVVSEICKAFDLDKTEVLKYKKSM